MELQATFSRCVAEAPANQNPRDACYMLLFANAYAKLLPDEGQYLTLTFNHYTVHAKIISPDSQTKAILRLVGNVTSVHQLGSILGLRPGDVVVLRKEGHMHFSLHQV